jgi:hypothetical protein
MPNPKDMDNEESIGASIKKARGTEGSQSRNTIMPEPWLEDPAAMPFSTHAWQYSECGSADVAAEGDQNTHCLRGGEEYPAYHSRGR